MLSNVGTLLLLLLMLLLLLLLLLPLLILLLQSCSGQSCCQCFGIGTLGNRDRSRTPGTQIFLIVPFGGE